MNTCKECGSTELSWDVQYQSISPTSQGRLRVGDVSAIAVLGCGECSETLRIIPIEKYIAELKAALELKDKTIDILADEAYMGGRHMSKEFAKRWAAIKAGETEDGN